MNLINHYLVTSEIYNCTCHQKRSKSKNPKNQRTIKREVIEDVFSQKIVA